MLSRFQRPRPIAWLFFLLAFGFTVAAGSWQVKRLIWKQGLIAELATAQEAAPERTLPTDEAELRALQFHPVRLSGRWVSGVEFHIAPRYVKDQFGYALVTPFRLTDGRIVMVNRGWIPGKKKELEKRPETKVRGATTIDGLVRIGAERNAFTPANQPEKNIWFGRDVAEMAASAKLDHVVPAMVDIVHRTPAGHHGKPALDISHLPVPSDGTIRLRNDHLSYIITWYGIALGILVIFLLAHRKK